MSRRITATALVAGVTVAVVFGGGLVAWAAMIVTSVPVVVTAEAAELPRAEAPDVHLDAGRPVISWRGVRTSVGNPVDRYVILRHDGDSHTTVCVAGEVARSCRDDKVDAGRTVRYTVRPEEGENWAGRNSPPSAAITVPADEASTGDAPAGNRPAEHGPSNGPTNEPASGPAGEEPASEEPAAEPTKNPEPDPRAEPEPIDEPEPESEPASTSADLVDPGAEAPTD